MSFYNLLFGKNPQAHFLLAVIGFREHDIERFRNVWTDEDGKEIHLYTRTGGGNREAYPQEALYKSPYFARTFDDDFDSTYGTFVFRTPEEFVDDVRGLSDILEHGLRKEFMQHIATTLRREPTEADEAQAAYEEERAALKATKHVMANGHTFVPYDDSAMKKALEFAEKNEGKLRTCWGILPLKITVERNKVPFPNATHKNDRLYMNRISIGYEWEIDQDYWEHCEERFAKGFPVSMTSIRGEVQERYRKETITA